MEQYGICTSRHVRTVSLVVTAVDDFTDRVITGSNVRVWIDGAKPPIRKSEGWHVFVGLPAGEYTVHAEGGFYNRTSCVCTVADSGYVRMKIRLTPGRNAPLASDTAVIEGAAAPGGRIFIRPDDRALAYKLLSDVHAGEERVGIYHPDGIDIEGKLLCIRSERGEEYVRASRSAEDDTAQYRLSEPLALDHPKIGTLVFPVSEGCADARGCFFIPIKNVPARQVPFVCMTEPAGDGQTITLSAGLRIRLEL